jgi:protein-disulfide isomerase
MRTTARGLLIGLVLFFTACSGSAQAPKQQGPSDIVATVGSVSITLAEVDEKALERQAADYGSLRLSQAVYNARRTGVDTLVGNMLLDAEAKARGMDRATLVDREITSKVTVPTDMEIAKWYAENPARVQGAPLTQVQSAIRAFLMQERQLDVRTRFVDSLKAKTPVTITLEPPREKVADAGRPSKGPANARVEVIEFSDFQCPYCERAYPVVQQVLSTYGDKIHFVYRNYPLPSHPNAEPAAEAAACAAEQGKFWEYHNRLFEHQDKLGDTDLKDHAAALGLDSGKFTICVNTHKYQKDIASDISAANDVGVTGTPAFFINGRPLDGAQPFDVFKEVIDEELKR